MQRTIKKWITPSFEEHSNAVGVKKGDKENSERDDEEVQVKNVPKVNFCNKIAPNDVKDLVVNAKKIAEVENWFENNLINGKNSNGVPMLLITGPTGCGKTTVVKLLCKAMNVEVVEWINPVSSEEYEHYRGPGQTIRLAEFLSETSKFPSLFGSTDSSKKITLLQDFPNSVVHNPSEFHTTVLEKCYSNGKTPIVFICTDTNDSNSLSHSLFPPEVQSKFGLRVVNFNPIPITALKKILKKASDVAKKYPNSFKIPSEEILDAIANSSLGDVRNALSQFQFACIYGSLSLQASNTNNANHSMDKGKKRKRSTKDKNKTVKHMLRDESLGLFHGLGRVLNPKRSEDPQNPRILCDFNALIDEFSTRPANFCQFLHANYPKYFGSLLDVTEAAGIISDAQYFLDQKVDVEKSMEINQYSLWIIVIGLMISNRNKVSRWNQIKAPTKIKNQVVSKEVQNAMTTDYCYYNIINKNSKYPTFKKR